MEQLSFLRPVIDMFYKSPRNKAIIESLVIVPEATPIVPVIGGRDMVQAEYLDEVKKAEGRCPICLLHPRRIFVGKKHSQTKLVWYANLRSHSEVSTWAIERRSQHPPMYQDPSLYRGHESSGHDFEGYAKVPKKFKPCKFIRKAGLKRKMEMIFGAWNDMEAPADFGDLPLQDDYFEV